MQSLVGSDQIILFSEIAQAIGVTGEIKTADLMAGGAYIPITAAGVLPVANQGTAAPMSMAMLKNVMVPYTPASATFNLDLPYDPSSIESFVEKFKTDVATKLGINQGSLSVAAVPTPEGTTTMQTTVKLPFNSNISSSVIDNLNILQSTTDPAAFLSPSTVQMLSSPAVSTTFVPPPIATAPPNALPLGSTSLSNDSFTIDLSTYFQSTPGVPLTYALEGNPFSNASLSNGILTVRGSQMDSNYSLNVVASTPNGQVSRASLAVTEVSPATAPTLAASLPPTVVSPLGSFTLSEQQPTASYVLSNVFVDPQGSALVYSLASNPVGSASLSANGILSLSGSLRDTTYPVTVAATNVYGRRADSTLSVTELAPPVPTSIPMGGIVLASASTCNIALDPFFTDSTGQGLMYALASNPKGSAIIGGGQLSVAGKLRGSSYSVVVAAKNVYGSRATSTLSVVESTGSKAPTTVGSLGSVTLGKNAYTLDTRTAFTDPIGVGLNYAVDGSNAYGAASVTSTGILTVQGASRNTAYTVGVRASNAAGFAVQSLSVTETAPSTVVAPPSAVATHLSPLTLSNVTTVPVSLASAFSGSALTYKIVQSPYNNAFISGSTMSVKGAFRGTTYPIVVSASNLAGRATSTIVVTELTPMIHASNMGSVTLDNTRIAYSNALSGVFTDSTGSGMTYRVSSSPYNNATISAGGVLTVSGAFRGLSYGVAVTARNRFNASATSTLSVTEAAAPVPPKLTGVPTTLSGSTTVGALTFPMASYQTATGVVGTLTWSLGGTQVPGVSIGATTGVLTVAKGSTASGTTIFVVVANPAGLFSSSPIALTLTCSRVQALSSSSTAPLKKTMPSKTFALAPLFYDAFGGGLTYALTSNPLSTATLSGSSLTISTAYSGTAYNVVVTVTDANGFTATFTVAVTETRTGPSTVGSVAPITVASSSNIVLSMASYLLAPYGGTFSLSSNPLGNGTIDGTSGQLTIAATGSNSSYSIGVTETDAYDQTASQTVSVTSLVAPTASAAAFSIASTSNAIVPTSGYFTNSVYATPTYALTSNPQSNAAIDASTGVVTLNGGGCNTQYSLGVRVTDQVGQAATQSTTVTSLVAPTATAAAFTIRSFSNLNISLSNIFTKSVYATPTYALMSNPMSNAYIFPSTGFMTVNGRGHNAQYTVSVCLTDQVGQVATQSTTITSLIAPTASAAAFSIASTSNATVPLSGYFTKSVYATPTYSLTSNPQSNATIDASTGVVTLNGGGCNAQYALGVRLTDQVAQFAAQSTTITSLVAPTASAAAFSIASTSNATVPLSGYFTKSVYATPTYSLTSNPQSNATIDASTGVVTLNGGGCNAQYALGVRLTDQVGQAATQSTTITSLVAPTASGTAGPFVVASTSNVSLAMSGYFSASAYAIKTYSLPVVFGNASINASTGVLSLAAMSSCNAQYTVPVRLTDQVGQFVSQNVTVTSATAPQTTAIPAITLAASSNASLTLSGYFASLAQPLAYSVTSSPNGNVTVSSNVATITSATRGTTYNVAFTATDTVGQTASRTVAVTEDGSVTVPTAAANYDIRSSSCYSGSGTTVNDLSGNGYTLVFNSAPTYNTSPKSITLTSSISAISSATPTINMTAGYSIETLFRYTTNTNNWFKVFSYTITNDGNGIQFQIRPENQIYLYNNATNQSYEASNVTLGTNKWHHVVFATNGTNSGTFYINGVSVYTAGNSNALGVTSSGRKITIGDQGRSRSMVGNFAIGRIYTSVLTAAQVSTLYSDVSSVYTP